MNLTLIHRILLTYKNDCFILQEECENKGRGISMEKKELGLEGYLSDCSPDFEIYVRQVHDKLMQGGMEVKVQQAKSGHVVSFTDPKSKKVIANFISRKKGPVIRIYGDNVGKYEGTLEELPEGMIKDIEKTSVCRRMVDPVKCNAKCPMGYAFTIHGNLYQKCRYNCFMFVMNAENVPSIINLLDHEIRQRVV